MTNSKIIKTYEMFAELNETLKKSKQTKEFDRVEEIIEKMSMHVRIGSLYAQIIMKCSEEFLEGLEETNQTVMNYFLRRLKDLKEEKNEDKEK